MAQKIVFDLDRFLKAQESVFETALVELHAGAKQSHRMWFVFPQLRGLGRSSLAQRYGISGLEEARAYLAHPILGLRLRRCVEAVLGVPDRSLRQIFGSPDDIKFRSSMTLFALADGGEPLFQEALDCYCDGIMDPRTVELLGLQ
ncbi:DUF1810 domain-containing protein [Aestuariivirga sp.]|uniref:DUF1810 domain-containing protein n=1 Tax=Aestuariivirga sp. TaxID=2650926 RepID=UPI003593AA6D